MEQVTWYQVVPRVFGRRRMAILSQEVALSTLYSLPESQKMADGSMCMWKTIDAVQVIVGGWRETMLSALSG